MPMNNLTPMQLIQFIKSGGNPQQMVMNMLQQTSGSNPMMANLLNLAKTGNGAGIEQVARNLLSSQGYDFDKEFSLFIKMMGIK